MTFGDECKAAFERLARQAKKEVRPGRKASLTEQAWDQVDLYLVWCEMTEERHG